MPTENLTTYTEVDPNNGLSSTASRVTATAWESRGYPSRLYKSFGTDHFASDFQHLFTVNVTAAGGARDFMMWQLCDDLSTWSAANQIAVSYNGDSGLYLIQRSNGFQRSDTGSLSLSTIYYCEVERDLSVAPYGEVRLRLYSDADRTSLVESLSLEANANDSTQDFEYLSLFVAVSASALGYTLSGYVENVDVQEAAAPSSHVERQIPRGVGRGILRGVA